MDINVIRHQFKQTIRHFLFACQIFGVIPVDVNFFNEKTSKKDEILKIGQILWSTILVSSITCASVYQNLNLSFEQDFVSKVLYFGEYAIFILNMLILLYGCHIKVSYYKEFVGKMLELYLSINRFNGQLIFPKLEKRLALFLMGFAVFFGVSLILDYLSNDQIVGDFFRSATVYILPNIIGVLSLEKYRFILYFIGYCYTMINETLQHFASDVTLIPKNKIDQKSDSLAIYHVIMSSDNLSFCYGSMVESLRKVHLRLSRLVVKCNSLFGVIVVITVVDSFAVLARQLFLLYKMSKNSNFEMKDIAFIFYILCWIGLYTWKLFEILKPCEFAVVQKNETGIILYKFDTKTRGDRYLGDVVSILFKCLSIIATFFVSTTTK